MRLKVGQLEPNFSMTLLEDGSPVTWLDESGVTVRMRGVQGVGELFDDTSPTVDTETATVTHEWVGPVGDTPGDTDAPGRVFVQAIVDRGDGRPIYFPSGLGFEVVDIEE